MLVNLVGILLWVHPLEDSKKGIKAAIYLMHVTSSQVSEKLTSQGWTAYELVSAAELMWAGQAGCCGQLKEPLAE